MDLYFRCYRDIIIPNHPFMFENFIFLKMEKNFENIIIVVMTISKTIKKVLQKLNIRKLKKISLENSKIPNSQIQNFENFEKIYVYLK